MEMPITKRPATFPSACVDVVIPEVCTCAPRSAARGADGDRYSGDLLVFRRPRTRTSGRSPFSSSSRSSPWALVDDCSRLNCSLLDLSSKIGLFKHTLSVNLQDGESDLRVLWSK